MTRKKKYSDLTPEDKESFLNLAHGEMGQMAEKLNINRNTAYYWRKCVLAEYKKPQQKLKGSVTKYIKNSNPPTELTETLVCNYYRDDIQRNMTHNEAIKDIRLTLGRTRKYILDVLRERKVIL